MDVAVLIPCFNEAATVAQVVGDFREALPEARIVVYDNGSDDGTADIAQAAGAEVRREASRGKGHVVRRMFADVDADVYVLVDGDATYDASSAPAMIGMLLEQRLDMVVARRCPVAGEAYRPGHRNEIKRQDPESEILFINQGGNGKIYYISMYRAFPLNYLSMEGAGGSYGYSVSTRERKDWEPWLWVASPEDFSRVLQDIDYLIVWNDTEFLEMYGDVVERSDLKAIWKPATDGRLEKYVLLP